MQFSSALLENAVNEFARLPGIGKKTALRLVLHLLKMEASQVQGFGETLIKMRLCRSGAKWKEEGAAMVLSIRTLVYTEERWEQFWQKVDRYGYPIAA